MKKLIACFAALAGIIVISCSDDDTETQVTNSCVTCTITMMGVTSSQEICNQDGNAYIDGTFVGNYEGWMNTMAQQGYSCQ